MKKILVIEDELALREDLVELLSAEGFEAIGAENGAIGVDLAQQHLPDLILCDVLMPVLDGYQTLATLRQDPKTASIPFIFLSAKGTAADFRQGLRLGADDYLTKPVEWEELLAAIATRLQKQAAFNTLQHKIVHLQQLNLFKDDFLSTVSHELRSPLANIMAALQVLQTTASDQQQHYLEALYEQCSREMALLNDLLDLQRLEAKVHQPILESVNLQIWLPAIAEPFEIRTQTYQQSLRLELAPDLPLLRSDSIDLGRIVSELLNNACKYTPTGGSIFLTAQPAATAWVEITVRNQAEIPAAALPHIFDRFYRATDMDFHEQGGSGLGLPLAQRLTEQLGGTLQAQSAAGWTTLTVRLPMHR